MATWQVHRAKARLSELLERAEREGPQIIARRGTERAVVLSVGDYRKLVKAQPNLRDYLLGGPKVDDFEIERPEDQGRAIDL
jgi:antitoxin Phd